MSGILKKLDWVLIGAVVLLIAIGLLSIASASRARTGVSTDFQKQLIFVFIGVVLFFVFSFTDYRYLRNHSGIILGIYFFSVFLLTLLLVIGHKIRGASSWFHLGSPFGAFGIEPVEITKFILVALLAKYFSGRHTDLGLARHVIVSGIYVFAPAALVLLQPNVGAAALMIIVWIGIMLASGIRMRHLLAIFFIFSIACGFGWHFFLKDYQKARIYTFLEPQKDPLGEGYNILQSMIAVGSGGIFGKGLGHGSQSQLNFLPEQHTDFIWATVAEEWGFFGVCFVLILFGIIFWRLFLTAADSNTNFARLFVFGFMVLLLAQIAINMGMNMGFLPVAGIPLPLLSYGGSNLVATLAVFGIVQNIRINS